MSWVFAPDSVLKTSGPGAADLHPSLPRPQDSGGGFRPRGTRRRPVPGGARRGRLGSLGSFTPAALISLGVWSFQVLPAPVPRQARPSQDIYSVGAGLGSEWEQMCSDREKGSYLYWELDEN